MEIYKKIQIIKATIGKISKNQENSFYHNKYFDINKLLEELEPLFIDQQLLCIQPIAGRYVSTEIIDLETDEKITSVLELPELTDPQKMGSCITYYRRYTLQSLLALQADDDDGNLATGKTQKVTTWLTETQFKATMSSQPTQIAKVLEVYDGSNGKGMKKEYREQLENILNE